jgi:uncharacterized protein
MPGFLSPVLATNAFAIVLEHIHIAPKILSIYDCIEFNDRFRYIDIANDVAFLAMDLDYYGRPDLSKQCIVRMANALCDPPMLRLIDFYNCYRAYVRGKVESFHQSAPAIPEQERRDSRVRSEGYFRLALQYAVSGSEPKVVVVMSRAASGKSTLARCLGRELGWEVFSSEETRKALAGVPIYKRCGPAIRRRLMARDVKLNEASDARLEDFEATLNPDARINFGIDQNQARRREAQTKLIATCRRLRCRPK